MTDTPHDSLHGTLWEFVDLNAAECGTDRGLGGRTGHDQEVNTRPDDDTESAPMWCGWGDEWISQEHDGHAADDGILKMENMLLQSGECPSQVCGLAEMSVGLKLISPLLQQLNVTISSSRQVTYQVSRPKTERSRLKGPSHRYIMWTFSEDCRIDWWKSTFKSFTRFFLC